MLLHSRSIILHTCSHLDIPDYDVKQKLIEINECTDEVAYNTLVRNFPERVEYGYNKFPSYDDKPEFLKTVAHHFIISLQLEEIQQFQNGLKTNNVLSLLQKYPEESKKFFTYRENCICPEDIKAIFVPHFSSGEGMEVEEDIWYNWHNFIDETGQKKTQSVLAFTLNDVEDGKVDESVKKAKTITLEDIVMFLTGQYCLSLPPPKVDVYFDHSSEGRVIVSTCVMKLTFPVTSRYNSENFSKNMIEDIINGECYGNV